MTLRSILLLVAAAALAGVPAPAQQAGGTPGKGNQDPTALVLHPGVQPRPGPSEQWLSPDGKTTFVVTPEGHFPSRDPFVDPPGSNFLTTVYEDMRDGNGVEMPNTLPSTPTNPYNLHDGDVIVTPIDPTSPSDDLRQLITEIRDLAEQGTVDQTRLQMMIDILEGNPIPTRTYSGFPLLHYNGPDKVKKVIPEYDQAGNKIGGNVEVHQIWYDSHIESDTAFIDPSDVQDVPWTVTYTVDVLNRGSDDFSPYVMYFDDPALSQAGMPPMAHVAMDVTFFPMEDGTRNVFKIKMSKAMYWNLTYHWGWRVHPPRVQVAENALKMINGITLPEYESMVFGDDPTADQASKEAAIAMIGDLAPAKRMWTVARRALTDTPDMVVKYMDEAQAAFDDWWDRTLLPRGVEPDPNSDLTLLYVNNTIYGEWADGRRLQRFWEWRTRPGHFKVTLLNGDYFTHGYMNVDFGGSRGWENQFQSTLDLGGSGCQFTFGRVHWWVNAGGPWGGIMVDPAVGITPSVHYVDMTLNFEPSRRLRLYQFDPMHHDVAVYSIH